jgi:hypothetical protein
MADGAMKRVTSGGLATPTMISFLNSTLSDITPATQTKAQMAKKKKKKKKKHLDKTNEATKRTHSE